MTSEDPIWTIEVYLGRSNVKVIVGCMLGLLIAALVVAARMAAPVPAAPVGNLKQIMRGIPYPNSEIIFAVQKKAPNTEDEWKVAQDASIAIAETANLITMPGRLRDDGKPVPVGDANWNKYARGLVTAAQGCYKAALAKDQQAVNKCTDGLSEACSNCHEVYRDVPQK